MANLVPAAVFDATAPVVRRVARTPVLVPLGLILFTLGAISASHHKYGYVIALAITGIGPGAIASLSGMGLILTYRATGVFNFAQGTIATLVGYIYWEMADKHHLPKGLAALIAVLVAGPAIGLILERVVFRPLDRRGASTSEKLVASLGLTVLVLGICVTIWSPQTRLASNFLPLAGHAPLEPFGAQYQISYRTIGVVMLLVITSLALTALFRFTRLGTEIRAVVDKRQLAELAGVNANRVASLSWALGCGFAGLVGVLYASSVALDPYRTTLLVIDTFAIAVIARLRDLPTAVIAGIVLGIVQAMVGAYHVSGALAGPLQADILAMALPIFLILYRQLDEVGTSSAATRGIVTARFSRSRRTSPGTIAAIIAIFAVIILVPAGLHGTNLRDAQHVVALAIAFLSIVAVTGFSGNITLGQAGFAGLGAFITGKLSTGFFPGLPQLPVIPAILLAAIMVAGLGVVTGYLVLRRRGLILGLFTIAMGIVLDTFVFKLDTLSAGLSSLHRPTLFGLDLSSDSAYFWFELVVFALALLLVRNLRAGRLGRILGAMRDSETATSSVGISLRTYKVFIFAAGAFLAAIGGALLMLSDLAFSEVNYSPLYSLFWFSAVVVAGLSYLAGAPVAAFLFVFFDAVFNRQGASLFVIGLLAVLIAYMPAGVTGTFYRITREGRLPRSLVRRYVEAQQQAADDELPEDAEPSEELAPTPLARELIGGRR